MTGAVPSSNRVVLSLDIQRFLILFVQTSVERTAFVSENPEAHQASHGTSVVMEGTNTREAAMGIIRKLETITNARGERHETIPDGGIEYHWAIIGETI